jgi:hypothetical protein
MRQFLTSIFLKTKGTSTISSVELPDCNLFTDPALDDRSIVVTPTSYIFKPFTLSCTEHTLQTKCSHQVLLSSKSSISSTINIKSVNSTVTENQELRTIVLSSEEEPKIKAYEDNTYTYKKSFYFDGYNINRFPNEIVTVKAGLNSDNTEVEFTLPVYSGGCTASTSISNVDKSVSSAAWGLILAAASDSQSLVISSLNSILNSFIQNGSLIQEDGGVSLGALLLPLSDSIYDNSLLGLSICLALKYISAKSNLSLAVDNFYKDCLVLAKSVALITSVCVNSSNGFCYGSMSSGSPNTEDLSFETSALSSLFFNAYLTLDYDSEVHYKAAKLYLAILELPLLPDTIQYSIFPDFDSLTVLAHRFWWNCEFGRSLCKSILDEYNLTRAPTPDNISAVYTQLDFLIASLSSLYLSINQPNWIYWLFQQYTLDYKLSNISLLPIASLSPICCYGLSFDLINNYEFNTYAISARAYTDYAKNLFIMTLPEGKFWGEMDRMLDRYSTIGILVEAYASSLFNLSLQISLLKQPLFSNSSYLLRKLAKVLMSPAIYLPEPVIKLYISYFMDSDLTPIEKLNKLFKTTFSRYYEQVSNYKVLTDLNTKTYSGETTVYNHEFLSDQEYKSIAFYPLLKESTQDQQQVSEMVLTPRTKPGLPYNSAKTNPAPGTSPSEDESNTHILPINSLTGLVNLESNITAPSNLYHLTNLLTPAGIIYKYLLHYFNTFYEKTSITSYAGNVVIGAKIVVGTTVIIV